ncbi:helicase [Moraxella atlantae]|uniref:Helicase n=1 Tax=Faucicola atlantae TaxID=34059 RepID=A0A1B8QD36_9GAMM|nr:NYN domain-containing protein [Moraxella atlantae]OBX79507.1 helicase [Moraxella atlantae]
MSTAVFIDGGFFIRRVRYFEPEHAFDAKYMTKLAFSMTIAHMKNKNKEDDDLYRAFFYDCPPLEKKMHNPISNKLVDFSKSDEAIFRRALHAELVKKRKFALRLGRLSDTGTVWQIKPDIQQKLLKNKIRWDELKEEDVKMNVIQKSVDMRIGLDIASVTLKKQVDKIVLISGDSDFVPASKLARREGIDFVLDPMGQNIAEDLFEHIDGLRSAYTQRKQKEKS